MNLYRSLILSVIRKRHSVDFQSRKLLYKDEQNILSFSSSLSSFLSSLLPLTYSFFLYFLSPLFPLNPFPSFFLSSPFLSSLPFPPLLSSSSSSLLLPRRYLVHVITICVASSINDWGGHSLQTSLSLYLSFPLFFSFPLPLLLPSFSPFLGGS